MSAVATADHPELLAQFPSLALVAPRKLLLPPITRPPIFSPSVTGHLPQADKLKLPAWPKGRLFQPAPLANRR